MRHWLIVLAILLAGCGSESEDRITLVFKHGKVVGDPAPLQALLEVFESEHPDIRVRDEVLPSSTDEQHQFYVLNLEGKSSDFDVFALDVIWVPEFAHAGWLRDISHLLPQKEREAFFPAPIKAVVYRGRVYAIPWYIDAGILYYRRDILEAQGFSPPKTWPELVEMAQSIVAKRPGMYGFIWQGKQYEGLVCNALEFMWSHGGGVLEGDKVVIDSPQNRKALAFMQDLIYRYKVTPAFVTSTTEEPARRLFGEGKAVFMRNWPYAWNRFQEPASPVRGKVGIAPLPAFPGHASASTLGGWQLGINRYSRHPKEAEKLVRFLTSARAQKALALTVGYQPTRRAIYRDAEILKRQPFMGMLLEVFERARPRPVTPFYASISQILQANFSAVLARLKTPQEALKDAQDAVSAVLKFSH